MINCNKFIIIIKETTLVIFVKYNLLDINDGIPKIIIQTYPIIYHKFEQMKKNITLEK